jgi:hypothetical protein
MDPPRKLYVLFYRGPSGEIRRSWFGTRALALEAGHRLGGEFRIGEAYI